MIPEGYWALIRRWFWLILLFSAAGAAGGFYLIPIGLEEVGEASSHNSSASLSVTRFLTSNGTVVGDSAMAEYTQSVAEMAKTPQFAARLNDAIAEEGVPAQELNPARKVKVKANKELSRITVQASADSPQRAELLVQKATELLIEQMTAEEQRVIDGLRESINRQRDEVLTRLRSLQEQRTELTQSLDQTALHEALNDLVQRSLAGTTVNEADEFLVILADLAEFAENPELALVSAEVGALQAKLAQLVIVQQDLAISLPGAPEPAFVLTSPETVPTEPVRSLRKRDMLVLGGGAGLVLGWISANSAEYVRRGWRNRDELGEEGDYRGPA